MTREREIEDQQVVNRLDFLSNNLLKNTAQLAKRNVFTKNSNKVRHVVRGLRKRYRNSGHGDRKIRIALMASKITGFVTAPSEKDKK